MHANIRHGQHALPDRLAREPAADRLKMAGMAVEVARDQPSTPFDYMFRTIVDDPANRLPQDDTPAVIASLRALGAAMVEEQPPPAGGDSSVPPIYTYWGQFIDHDVTLTEDLDPAVADMTDPAFVPLAPDQVVATLRNLREPTLELDSVYEGAPRDGAARLQVGRNATENVPGEIPPPTDDLDRDLPRGADKKALIGDPRNDENLIVAQFHTAFLRFHNAVVDWVTKEDAGYSDAPDPFERARELTRWHYQWLVVHDYLETLTRAGSVDRVLLDGPKHYVPEGRPFMPIEFSGAGFRFGHSMVRAGYDHNRNFGQGAVIAPFASLDQLFQFTGMHANPFLGFGDTLPFNWIIEWDRFVDKGSALANRFARRIDTRIAPPLAEMLNEGNDPALGGAISALLKQLAQRNLLRGYLLSLPTGQAVARAMDVRALSEDEILQGNSDAVNQILADNGFAGRTPLWFYLLKEAEVQANGNTLGEVGSRLIIHTIVGLIRHDPHSYMNQEGGWTPAQGVRLENGDPVVTIRDFLRFAKLVA